MPAAYVTSKGQIVIPAEIRKRHAIRKGTRIDFEDRGDEIVLRQKNEAYFDKLAGFLGTDGESWSQALIEQHQLDREREDR
jgi:AbrB family looped-hinge helix DNA binding protein